MYRVTRDNNEQVYLEKMYHMYNLDKGRNTQLTVDLHKETH